MPLEPDDQRQVEKFKAKLEPALAEARKWQMAINAVYEVAGEPPPYQLGAMATAAATAPAKRAYGRAEFYGQPLATVVRRILLDNGPLDDNEIYTKMVEGGFTFDESNPERAKNNLKISLGKNIAFGRTSTGYYTVTDGASIKLRAKKPAQAGSETPAASAAPDAETSPGLKLNIKPSSDKANAGATDKSKGGKTETEEVETEAEGKADDEVW